MSKRKGGGNARDGPPRQGYMCPVGMSHLRSGQRAVNASGVTAPIPPRPVGVAPCTTDTQHAPGCAGLSTGEKHSM